MTAGCPQLGSASGGETWPEYFVPTMLQSSTGGVKEVEVTARNVRQVIDKLEEMFPALPTVDRG